MSISNCDRCGRELVDPQAQCGWRCEKIMETAPTNRTIKDSNPALYYAAMYASEDFLTRYGIDPNLVDLEKFCEATAEYMFLKSMPPTSFDTEARRQTFLKACEAFGFEMDRVDPQVFLSDRLSSMVNPLLDYWLENEVNGYTPPPPEIVYAPIGNDGVPWDTIWDGLQTGIDLVGLIPGVGEIADGVNAGISTLRGNYLDAALSLAAMIPLAGIVPTGGKLAKNALRYGDDVLDAAKHADEIGEWAVRYGDEFVGGAGRTRVSSLDDFVTHPRKLGEATPTEWYQHFKDNGYDPQPMSKGGLGGVPFEEGGGFKVNWGGDRILQYHPAGLNHHGGGAYYKISSGPTGVLHFDLFGNPLPLTRN